jgi:hypothetical protein
MNLLLSAATLCWLAVLTMAIYVGLRREKQAFHWLLCGFSFSLVIWLSGSIVRQTLPTQEGLRIGIHLIYTGLLTVPPLWLLLAAHHARSRVLSGLAPAVLVAFPSALFFLALLTNDGHRLRCASSRRGVRDGPSSFAGPLFGLGRGRTLRGARVGYFVAPAWKPERV